MSKAKQLRQMQDEINSLKSQLEKVNKRLIEYQKRDNPRAGDNIYFNKKVIK